MRAVVIRRFGDPGGMAVVEIPVPTPPTDHVLIRTEAIGVGGVDAVIRRGTLGAGFRTGMIPGSEVAGIVEAVGASVDSSWIGRRVWAFTGTDGGYAEHTLAPVGELVPIPESLASVDAVTLGSAATVAHFALAHAHLSAGESVLVRGAAGSIGIATVELARRGGAKAIAVTTSSVERGLQLKRLGATELLSRSGQSDSPVPKQFDVIIDIVGGPDMPAFLDRLAPNGRMILVGAVAGLPPENFGSRLLRAFQQSRSFATFSLASIPLEARDTVRAEVFDAAVRGELHPIVHAVMPLDHAAEAHRQMDLGAVLGRIVLTP
ncbi:zinc-dependent alcohol dehydrogenase family protein [Microbacterium allomyrinae]|uniref:Zinc-dependent alcohol dehydrogenase family protein n=1 Tax=Microbacterium allomyrinae TaxID=2830666 RepID=A0A9X1S2C9_9MICO|nr:zinc-dependent alcohol dehydrogenase family protein [Microbacterium allomyrinae]MCC2031859.1 zinc-dependent alcohol dehydrogenase family protein [Microbacterium allomyrinae]